MLEPSKLVLCSLLGMDKHAGTLANVEAAGGYYGCSYHIHMGRSQVLSAPHKAMFLFGRGS